MDYADILETIASCHEEDSVDAWVETAAIREAAEYIKKLERALDIYAKERTRFKHSNPEITGAYFISGESGDKDDNFLPKHIWICPAYGCDWSQHYVRTDKTSEPEY